MPVSNGYTALRREAVFKKSLNLRKALGPPTDAKLQAGPKCGFDSRCPLIYL